MLFLLTVQYLISLSMLGEFLNSGVFMEESQLPMVEAKRPETHFLSPFYLIVVPRGLVQSCAWEMLSMKLPAQAPPKQLLL